MAEPRWAPPRFILDAFGDASDAPCIDEEMSCLIEPVQPSAALRERLLASLERPVLRYAPFCARVADLFDISEERAAHELAQLAEKPAWRAVGLPGIQEVRITGGPRVARAEALFVRFAPGTYFPRHRHAGQERVLVLEGEYTDDAGVRHQAGELREWAEGSDHSLRVASERPCIVAAVLHGSRFHAWPLRLLARVLGR